MINSVKINNFGPISGLEWQHLGNINLIIGKNGKGKTFLLKALYTAIKTLEEYKRGNDKTSLNDILQNKLYWTFQPDKKIGDLVTKKAASELTFTITLDNNIFSYCFGKDTTQKIQTIENQVPLQERQSIYLPAKEVLSLFSVILQSRDHDKIFGFDDTYYDLVRALQKMPMRGKFSKDIASARQALSSLLQGRIEYDEQTKAWQFNNTDRQKFPIGVTAEGIKKISILDTLLGSRYLVPGSVVFIDEPESALHPGAISNFMEIISLLSAAGIQFVIATHSYFVIKKLYLISQEKKTSIPVLSMEDGKSEIYDLLDGMPENSIIKESINLYQEEINLVAKS